MLDRFYLLQEMVADHQQEMLAVAKRARSLRQARNEPQPLAPIVDMGRYVRGNPGRDEQEPEAVRRLRAH